MFKIRVVYILIQLIQPTRKKVHENKDAYKFCLPQCYPHGIGQTAFDSPGPRVRKREELADDVDRNAGIEGGPL